MKLEYRTLKEKMKEYNKKEAKFYGNMFARMNKLGALETNVSHLPPSDVLYVAYKNNDIVLDGFQTG